MKKVKVHAGIKLRAEFADVMGVHAGFDPSLSVGRGYALSDVLGDITRVLHHRAGLPDAFMPAHSNQIINKHNIVALTDILTARRV